MAGDIEKVQTTITAQLDDAQLTRIRSELREKLSQTLGEVKINLGKDVIPTAVAEAEMRQAGKRFGVKGKMTEQLVTSPGGPTERQEVFSTTIAELKNQRDKIWEADLKKWAKQRKEFLQTIVPETDLISSGKKASDEINAERKKVLDRRRKERKESAQREKDYWADIAAGQKDVKRQVEASEQRRKEFQQTIVPESDLISSGKKVSDEIRKERKEAKAKRNKERERQADVEKGYQADLAAGMNAVNAEENRKARELRRKEVETNKKAAKKRAMDMERAAAFRNSMLVGASGAIGLFGTAGFAALNVGFAAMSGGPWGAGIAAATTAIGETTRALNEMSQANIDAARSLGFISRSFKEVEATANALKAAASVGATTAQRLGEETRNEMRRKTLRKGDSGEVMESFSEAWKTTWLRLQKDPLSGGNFIRHFWDQLKNNTASSRLQDAETSRTNFLREMSKGTPGVGNDPFTEWLRIQNAALDMNKSEEARLAMLTIKTMEENIEVIRKNTKAMEARENRGFPPALLTNGIGF